MPSSRSCSDLETYNEYSKDQNEYQPEPEGGDPLQSASASVASTHPEEIQKSIYTSKYHIQDNNQQILVLDNEERILKAVPRQGDTLPEVFDVLPVYVGDSIMDVTPIFLAVLNGNLCLCCDIEEEEPTLQLKEINIHNLKSLDDKDRLPYIFLLEKNKSFYTLESMTNRGYFIYTSMTPRQPVGVTKNYDQNNIHFQFTLVHMNLYNQNSEEAK